MGEMRRNRIDPFKPGMSVHPKLGIYIVLIERSNDLKRSMDAGLRLFE